MVYPKQSPLYIIPADSFTTLVGDIVPLPPPFPSPSPASSSPLTGGLDPGVLCNTELLRKSHIVCDKYVHCTFIGAKVC